MDSTFDSRFNRRAFLAGTAAAGVALAGGAASAQQAINGTEMEQQAGLMVDRNMSSFRMLDWRAYFPNLRNGAILADTRSRAVHYWSEDESIYRLFPSSVPVSDELTRLGTTEVVRKAENPTWTPTASMRQRFPDWPPVIPGGVPENPLGVRALYLTWPAYLIHGTHDTRKIGRRSSDGCIGLYNEHILQLYDLAKVGTQVRLI